MICLEKKNKKSRKQITQFEEKVRKDNLFFWAFFCVKQTFFCSFDCFPPLVTIRLWKKASKERAKKIIPGRGKKKSKTRDVLSNVALKLSFKKIVALTWTCVNLQKS